MEAIEPALQKGLPSSVEAEKSVLGAILLDNTAYNYAAELLTADDFSHDAHRRIFTLMVGLMESLRPIDAITLTDELIRTGSLDAVGGVAYLSSLTEGLPRSVNVAHYARIVKDKALLRRLIHTTNSILRQALDAAEETADILDRAESSILAVAEDRGHSGLMPLGEIFKKTYRSFDDLLDRGQRITGLKTGFRRFDELTCGLQPSDLILIAARPSMGKTAWALSVAANVGVHSGLPVGIFSLEMSREALLIRLLCAEARVDSHKFRQGFLNKEEMQRLGLAMGRLAQAPIFIDDTPGMRLQEMHAKARRMKREHGLALIILDYIQLMNGPKAENRNQEISALSRGLKAMAKEMAVPLVALSQLSRAPETRDKQHIPQLSDLRDSGCLAGGALINLPDGRRVQIGELEGLSGFNVLALNERTWKLEPATVSRAFCTGRKPVFRLRTQLGNTIVATGNHRFRTIDRWERLDALRLGDHIALPRSLPTSAAQTMSDNQLALLGHLIGDGCTLPKHVIQLTTRESDLAVLVSRLASEVFGDSVQPRVSPERRWFQVYLPSTRRHTHGVRGAIREWLEGLGVFGLRSYEKHVPAEVFQQPESAIAVFLSHLWSTDGHVGIRRTTRASYPNVFYATSSERLAQDVQALLLRLGVISRLTRVSQGNKGRDQYHVLVTGHADLVRFLERIEGVGERRSLNHGRVFAWAQSVRGNTNRDVIPKSIWKDLVGPARKRAGVTDRQLQAAIGQTYCGSSLYRQNVSRERAARIAAASQSAELAALATSQLYWDRLASVEPAGEELVYDLTVPGPHNFVANEIIVHNSLEQDADLVGFLYREEYYLRMQGREVPDDKHGVAELIVAKQRNGPTDKVPLAFLDRFARFDNIAEGIEPS